MKCRRYPVPGLFSVRLESTIRGCRLYDALTNFGFFFSRGYGWYTWINTFEPPSCVQYSTKLPKEPPWLSIVDSRSRIRPLALCGFGKYRFEELTMGTGFQALK